MSENEIKNENEHTYDNGFHPKEVKLKENYDFYNKHFFYLLGNKLIILFTACWMWFLKYFVFGFRVVNKKNRKNIKGSVVICNHVHQFDAFMTITNIYPKQMYITMLQSNLGFGFVSWYFRTGGGVPIPEDLKQFKRFNSETKKYLEEKRGGLLVYPEAALMPYCDHIRPFMSGAFSFAIAANATIIPCVYTFHKPKGLYKLTTKGKPVVHLNYLEPYTIKDMGNKKLTLETTSNELHEIMSNYFDTHTDIEYRKNKN